jgi:multidrug efflux system membrane fusion protein
MTFRRFSMKTGRLILLLTFWTVFLLSGCGKEPATSTPSPAQKIRDIKIAEARLQQIDVTFSAPGTVRPSVRSTLTSKVIGNVTKVLVKEGDLVEKGDPLIEIESRDITAKIRQAQGALESARAGLRNAEANFRRTSELFSKGSATRFELDAAILHRDRAKGRVEQSKGALQEARTMKRYARIVAPAKGVIARRPVDVGDQAAPGRPLIEFEETARLQFEAFVPESVFPSLKTGEKVSVALDALDDTLIPGTITEMEASTDPVSHSAKIRIDLEKTEGALSGMYGRALIPTGRRREAVLIPAKGVIRRGQLTAVYLLDSKGIVHFRLIQTGRPLQNRVEVLAGLEGGERIAVSGLDRLEDGMEVSE